MTHSIVWKYRPPKHCKYPYSENSSVMYCWGLAGLIDKIGRKEAIKNCKEKLCKKCACNKGVK